MQNENTVIAPEKPKFHTDTNKDTKGLAESAIDILDNNERVKTSLKKIKNCIHFINSTGEHENQEPKEKTFKAKLDRFLSGKKEVKFLNEFWQHMDSKKSELNFFQNWRLKNIQKKLNKNKDISQRIVNELLAIQTQDLNRDNLPVNKITDEKKHIAGVSILSQVIFSDSPLLHLIAPVHDFIKHNVGYTDLGLHEIASTYMGPIALEEVLKKYQKKLNLGDNDIKIIGKLARRAIYTHGDQEFPQEKSKKTEFHENIYNLFGGLYFFTKKRSVNLNKKRPTIAEKTIAQINYVDSLEGTSYISFIKYNTFNSNSVIKEYDDVSSYITNNILVSFDSNINMRSGEFLKKFNVAYLDKIVNFNTLVKNTIVSIANNDNDQFTNNLDNQDKIEANKSLDRLKKLHQKLKDSEELQENRVLFDQEINIFMTTIYQAVNKKVG